MPPRGRRANTAAAVAPAATGRGRRGRTAARPAPFAQRLVLNQWLFSLFGIETVNGYLPDGGRQVPALEKFKLRFNLNENSAEGFDENNISKFYYQIINQTESLPQLPKELLLEYDQNIVKHTQRLNARRVTRGEKPIVWKYFQYLSLLFTEIYLDRYFADASKLLADINAHVVKYNAATEVVNQVTPLDADKDAKTQINKLSFWNATGSGKTLIMHVNILQYQYYLKKNGQDKALNRVILLTPNEGLSNQHLQEFQAAGIEAELFSEEGTGLFTNQSVEIIDIHKLKEEKGAKTFAIEAFEGNNLVLVDEGHRGASSEAGAWMKARNALCESGFSFEYSATFSQAVKSSPNLAQIYSRSILFDYSYRYFYGDGYGKDYNILNLDEGAERRHRAEYLTACLMAFYQQLRLYRDKKVDFQSFNIEKPLWIFVGSRVTASLATQDASDIVEILSFLSGFVTDKDASIEKIARILSHGLLTEDEKNIFEGRFSYITELALQPKELFADILSVLFNAPNGGAFRVRNIKGISGEISLQVGDNKPFGVINVGDDSGLIEKCKEAELETGESEFSQSLFSQLNAADSNLHLLIGSKKFTEGWNSWRVSTMGLMNVGATEGAQIIQLFGRGVRLKGYNDCLKRSSRVDGVTRPYHIGLLETLNIFGIRANYMQQFREYLEEEGLPTNEDREELFLPVIKNLGKKKLKTIRLKKTIDGISTEFDQAFKKLAPVPTFAPPAPEDIYLQRNKVVLNWYPKVQALRASGITSVNTEMDLHETRLREEHIALLDIDELYFELQQYKAERSWHNLNLSRKAIEDVLADQSWYLIQIPAEDMAFDRYENVAIWQQLASSLLRKYCERYYLYQKKKWEEPHLEYHDLDANDPNFPAANDEYPDGYYRFLLDQSQQEIATQLKTLKKAIEEGKLQDVSYPGFEAIFFHQHLYQPLIHLKGMSIEVSPVALNLGEKKFVLDLRSYYEANKPFFEKREMYLLRNLSKGRGVGFFEAGNFHPDFILWLLDGDKQYITFIDPKGIRHLGKEDPKVSFYKTIKEIETRLNDDKVILNSFLVSNTHSSEMKMLWKIEKAEMEACHIVFQEEDSASYIGKIMNGLL